MAFAYWLIGALPSAPDWGKQEAYNAILGQTPRIVLASLVAYFCGEFVNSFILAKMKILTRGRWLWTRTIELNGGRPGSRHSSFRGYRLYGAYSLDGFVLYGDEQLCLQDLL